MIYKARPEAVEYRTHRHLGEPRGSQGLCLSYLSMAAGKECSWSSESEKTVVIVWPACMAVSCRSLEKPHSSPAKSVSGAMACSFLLYTSSEFARPPYEEVVSAPVAPVAPADGRLWKDQVLEASCCLRPSMGASALRFQSLSLPQVHFPPIQSEVLDVEVVRFLVYCL